LAFLRGYFGIYIRADRKAPMKINAEERIQSVSEVCISAIRTEIKNSCFLYLFNAWSEKSTQLKGYLLFTVVQVLFGQDNKSNFDPGPMNLV